MATFTDNLDVHQVIINLLSQQNGVQYFEVLWNLIGPTNKTLIQDPNNSQKILKPDDTALMNIISHKNQDIDSYLFQHHQKIYYETLGIFLFETGNHEGFSNLFSDSPKSDKASKLIKAILRFGSQRALDLLVIESYRSATVIGAIFAGFGILETQKLILDGEHLTDQQKMTLLLKEPKLMNCAIRGRSSKRSDSIEFALHLFDYCKNHGKALIQLLENGALMELCITKGINVDACKLLRFLLFESILSEGEKWKLLNIENLQPFLWSIMEKQYCKSLVFIEYYKNNYLL